MLNDLVKNDTLWHDASNKDIDAIVLSLAYEGDVHTSLFPSLEVLWLDDNRPKSSDNGAVTNYSVHRIEMLNSWVQGENVRPQQKADFLAKLDKAAWITLAPSEASNLFWDRGRDKGWFDLIVKQDGKSTSSWAVIIVGSGHVLNEGGRLANFLTAYGKEIIVVNLETEVPPTSGII